MCLTTAKTKDRIFHLFASSPPVSVCNRTSSHMPDRRHSVSLANVDNAFGEPRNFPLRAPTTDANLRTPSRKNPCCSGKEQSSQRFLLRQECRSSASLSARTIPIHRAGHTNAEGDNKLYRRKLRHSLLRW